MLGEEGEVDRGRGRSAVPVGAGGAGMAVVVILQEEVHVGAVNNGAIFHPKTQ